MNKYSQFKDGFYCHEHKLFFDNTCPKCTPPLIADGKEFKRKLKPYVEQGIEQGVTSHTRELVRSHAFRFVLDLPVLTNWDKRDGILKGKGYHVEPKAGIGKVFLCSVNNFKCWFADKSITIYFPKMKDYFVEEARFGYNYAIYDLLTLIYKMEELFSLDFKVDGKYKFRVAGQHHALIHNSLAKMYNRNKEKLNVYDEKGTLWLIVDNSAPDGIGLNELETVRKSVENLNENDSVRDFFNELKDTRLMPSDVLDMFKQVAIEQSALIKDRAYYADNLKEHVKAIKSLAFIMRRMSRRIK